MISIDEARSRILDKTRTNEPIRLATGDAIRSVLAQDVTSDIDSPPHDKSLVDGFAVIASDTQSVPAELKVIETITAGMVPRLEVTPGTAARIMTGAPLPRGADAVVMVEQTTVVDPKTDRIRIDGTSVPTGEQVMRCGAAIQRGATVLKEGHILRPVDIGLLSEVGCRQVHVIRRPRVSVFATGNELVPPDQVPEPGQIRNSNGPMLAAMVRGVHGEAHDLGICPDRSESLKTAVLSGLDSDILVLSGGVSMGTLDLVPEVLEQLGVVRVFHKIRVKPGKPLWFGTREDGSHRTLVFGLPGNPVGAMVCFELFVAPVIRRMRGLKNVQPEPMTAVLSRDHRHQSDRPTYFPAHVRQGTDGRLVATPVSWRGSADQRAVGTANCLAFFPAGNRRFAAGEEVPVLFLGRGDDSQFAQPMAEK